MKQNIRKDQNDIKKDIVLNEKELKEEYQNHLEVYRSPASARYLYLDIDKNDLVKNIKVTDEQAMKIYNLNLEEGVYVDL